MPTNSLIDQLTPYVVPIIVAACVTGVTGAYHWILARLPAAMQTRVNQVAQQVVAAVEQSHPASAGQDKKSAAVAQVNAILASLHFPAPPALIESAIESAVFTLNQFKPKAPGQS